MVSPGKRYVRVADGAQPHGGTAVRGGLPSLHRRMCTRLPTTITLPKLLPKRKIMFPAIRPQLPRQIQMLHNLMEYGIYMYIPLDIQSRRDPGRDNKHIPHHPKQH